MAIRADVVVADAQFFGDSGCGAVGTALNSLFRPRSVAIVGASDKNPWSRLMQASLDAIGFVGPVHLVNRSGNPALGRETVASCTAIGEPVDAAFVVVPAGALEDALSDMARSGIRYGAVVTSGFAELGEAGAAEQTRIFGKARADGLTLMGPNSLGFINYVDRTAMSAVPVARPLLAGGRIGLVSQSGATTSIILEYGARQGIGFTYAIALGNEAIVDLAQVVDFLLADEATAVIAVYAEAIRDTSRFVAACQRALHAGKPIVILKAGSGEIAAQVALAHTGALVGNDRVFDAVCRRYGVVRVRTLEQLVTTSDLLAYTGVMDPRPVAALSISGGACAMFADMAEAERVPLAALAPATLDALRATLPPFGTAGNPLDVTGVAMSQPEILSRSVDALAADDGVGLVVALQDPPYSERAANPISRSAMASIAAGFARTGKKSVLVSQTSRQSTEFQREITAALEIPHTTASIAEVVKAIAAGRAWSDRVRSRDLAGSSAGVEPATERPDDERQALDYLASRGVPVVPGEVVGTGEAAAAAAARLGGPVALKILSPDIAHKTEVGGVALGVEGGPAAAEAFARIMADVGRNAPHARIVGVIVAPMRRRGVELFVGVTRDPMWGLVIAVGLGGIWVELLDDVSLRTLPIREEDALEMLGELKGGRLLDGFRGAPSVDRSALARTVAVIGDAALAIGPDLDSLEINPLNAGPDGVEALDALVVWNRSGTTSGEAK